MRPERERSVINAFVSIANNLVDTFDIIEMLNGLTTDCARLLDVGSAGLLLADHKKVLHVMAASSEATRSLELFQIQRDDGPCLDCYRTGQPISIPDLEQEASRWPIFSVAAANAGVRAVHAIPLRLDDTLLGALGLFGTSVGGLEQEDLALSQALAHVASIAIVSATALTDKEAAVVQLQNALQSRVVIEQAKGLLAQLGGLDMETAFSRMRNYARSNNERISDVAGRLVSRSLSGDVVLAHPDPRVRGRPNRGLA